MDTASGPFSAVLRLGERPIREPGRGGWGFRKGRAWATWPLRTGIGESR